MSVVCVVPQGSIMGPKLFIMYINDICNVSNILKFVLFADDTNIFCSGKDINQLSKLLCIELDKLNIWFAVNKLSLNVSKTNFMIFFINYTIRENINIRINNCVIDRIHVTKFLGVLIDEKLKWKKHITLICSKLSKSIGVIYKASRLLNTPALYTLYCTLFLPFLNYCAEVWGNTYKSNILPLIMKQKSYQNCM